MRLLVAVSRYLPIYGFVMRSSLPLPSDTPEMIARVARIGHAIGAAVFVTGVGDRFEAANQECRKQLPCCSFDERPEFAAAFLRTVETGINTDACITQNPEHYLRSIENFRRSERATFIKSYGDNKSYCMHYRYGDWTTRITIPLKHSLLFEDLEVSKINDVELFASMQAANATLVAALDETPQPTAFLFKDAQISYWNKAMLRHLQKGDGLEISSDGKLVAKDEASNIELRRAVEVRSRQYGSAIILTIKNSSGRPVQLATITTAGSGLSMIQLPVPTLEHTALITLLRTLGLPPGRARIAAAIGAGATVNEVSERYGIAKVTARTEVKNITSFIDQKQLAAGKGLRSIIDLVTKLATIAGNPGISKGRE